MKRRDAPMTESILQDLPYPARVKEIGKQITELKAATVSRLAIFREALREFAGQWMRETAKRTAIAQNSRTLSLGRGELGKLKRAIEDHVGQIDQAIADEFTLEKYGDAAPASSGQVSALVERKFGDGIRRVLATVNGVLEAAGYVRDDSWLEADLPDGQKPRYASALELPPDIADLIGKIAEAITDIKVAEAKLQYYDKQRDKEMAAELWENS